jgi:hypothetical protein
MRSDDHVYSGASAFAKGVQRCLALTRALAPFSPELGTDTHECMCRGELPLILAPMEISRVPSAGPEAAVSGFGNEHVPRTLLAMLLMYIQDYKSFMNHDA